MKYYKASKILSNGQVATVFWCVDVDAPRFTTIGFRIGKSISENKRWWNTERSASSTGTCGLEGLLFALQIVKQLQQTEKGLTVCWLDERRHRVYNWLKRYGFEEGRYSSNKETCLFWTK